MKPTDHGPDRVVTYLPMEYEPTPDPPIRLRSLQPPAGDYYDQIEYIDYHEGITRWKDGAVTRWQGASRRATFDPEVQSSPEWAKWRARVQSYWGSHKYECQVCGLDRDEDGILQRPVNVSDGPIKLYLATGSFEPGGEPDDELLALCDPCATETSELAYEHGPQDWGRLVLRLQGKRKPKERRRRDLLSKQAQERRHKRARTQEYKEKLAGHIERYKTEGIPIPREFVYEYADVHRR